MYRVILGVKWKLSVVVMLGVLKFNDVIIVFFLGENGIIIC